MSLPKTLTTYRPTVNELADELDLWLQWAGATLLSMKISSPYPKEYKVSWPAFAQLVSDAYAAKETKLTTITPSAKQIELMDKILILPNYIEDINTRRIINARLLVTPISQRPLYSWTRLARMINANRQRVALLHRKGLVEIIENMTYQQIDALRHSFTVHTEI